MPPEQLHREFLSVDAALDYTLSRQQYRYTDDGQMALALAKYLTAQDSIEPNRLMEYFVRAYEPWRGYGRGARVLIEAFRDAFVDSFPVHRLEDGDEFLEYLKQLAERLCR